MTPPPAVALQTSPAPRHYALFVCFIAIIGAFSSLVNDMYLPTIPAMRHEFHTTPSMTQLGLSMAMIGMGIGSVIWGSLSDSYGRKRILVISLIIFAVSTLAAIFSPTIQYFISLRLIQGLGAGGAMVLSTSIPADIYAGRQLGKLMGLVGAINGVAPAAGPLIGGLMADSAGWRGIFILLLAIGIIMTLWSLHYKETLPPQRRLASKGLRSYIHSYRILLCNGRFMIYVLIKGLGIAVLYAYISSGPFILQDHYHFSALLFGVIFGLNALALAAGAMLAPHFRIMKNAMVGASIALFVFAAAFGIVIWLGLPFLYYELTGAPMLFCLGVIFSSSNTLAMDVGRSEAGTASAILGIVKYILASVVAPICGMGNLMHSSAIAISATAFLALTMAFFAARLSPLPDMVKPKH